MHILRSVLFATFITASPVPFARAEPPQPQNVVQLAASGTAEVPQDMLTMVLSTTREAQDAATVQAQLKTAVEAAVAAARPAAAPGQLELHTGNFNVQPRYSAGHIASWVGSAELILEGKDVARVAQTAGRVPGMTVASSGFGLSREQRTRVESEAQGIAIERFKARAAEIARSFGFGGYTLREVAVNASEPPGVIRPRMMAATAKAADTDSAVPVEAGRTAVTVSVSGTVQLR